MSRPIKPSIMRLEDVSRGGSGGGVVAPSSEHGNHALHVRYLLNSVGTNVRTRPLVFTLAAVVLGVSARREGRTTTQPHRAPAARALHSSPSSGENTGPGTRDPNPGDTALPLAPFLRPSERETGMTAKLPSAAGSRITLSSRAQESGRFRTLLRMRQRPRRQGGRERREAVNAHAP